MMKKVLSFMTINELCGSALYVQLMRSALNYSTNTISVLFDFRVFNK